jgi:DNA-binding NarL/FixJ family response regulator
MPAAPLAPASGTVLIVEDHPLFRGAMISLIATALPGLAPVAASSAEEGLKLARTLADVRMVLLVAGRAMDKNYTDVGPGVDILA